MSQPPGGPPPQAVIMQMVFGQFITKGLAFIADLGVADVIGDGEQDIGALARASDTDPDALYRVMRMLTVVGVFDEAPGRRFCNTPLSNVLRGDVPGSMRAMVRWMGCHFHWSLVNEFEHSVRTGRPTFDKLFPGVDVFEVLSRHEHAQMLFQEAMTGLSADSGKAVVDAYDFSGLRHIVDVGGGHGTMAMLVKHKAPDARVTVFDLPFVIEGAQEAITAAGLGGKVKTVSGSFFEAVPGPADALILKSIIHDWPDDDAVRILSQCREQLSGPSARVLVCEMLVGDGPESAPAKFLDIEMLLGPGGRERSSQEYGALFARAGLRLSRVIPTQSPMCIVEAVAG